VNHKSPGFFYAASLVIAVFVVTKLIRSISKAAECYLGKNGLNSDISMFLCFFWRNRPDLAILIIDFL
jgi:hypothetical protein